MDRSLLTQMFGHLDRLAEPHEQALLNIQSAKDVALDAAGITGYVVGNCEDCGTVIIDDDDYFSCEDGLILCPECKPTEEEIKAEAAHQATEAAAP